MKFHRSKAFRYYLGMVALSFLFHSVASEALSEFFSTKITFTFADDNTLVGAGETKNSSPSAYFGRDVRTALDRTTPSYSMYENYTHLAVYKQFNFSQRFVPEAALIMKFDLNTSRFADDGSFIKFSYVFGPKTYIPDGMKHFGVELFPIDANRFQLGFIRDLQWGGTPAFPRSNNKRGISPGLKLNLMLERFHMFLGMKTALLVTPSEDILTNEGGNKTQFIERTYYAGLLGLGVDIHRNFRAEIQGAVFQKGTNTRFTVIGQPILSGGGTIALTYHMGDLIDSPLDLRLYREDPYKYDIFKKITPSAKLNITVSAEFSLLAQTLEDADHVGSTKIEWAKMGGLAFKLQKGGFRGFLYFIYRDLPAIIWNVPGFVPNQALPARASLADEFFITLMFDYTFKKINLTPYFNVGLLLPSTFTGVVPEGPNAPQISQGSRTTVIRGSNATDWDILPSGEKAVPVFISRLGIRWMVQNYIALIGEVMFGYDNNVAEVRRNEQGFAVRVFDMPYSLGFALISSVQF